MREGIARLLTEAGFEVVAQAADAEEFLRKALAHHPDAAVVDVRMPPGRRDDGLRAALKLRAQRPEVGVLVLSQYYEESYPLDLIGDSAEGVGYLLKERVGDVAAFTDAVRRVASGGSALDPDVVARMLGHRASETPLDLLSPRERDVLAAMAEGKSNRGIAAALCVSEAAVEKHVTNIFIKLRLAPEPNEHPPRSGGAHLRPRRMRPAARAPITPLVRRAVTESAPILAVWIATTLDRPSIRHGEHDRVAAHRVRPVRRGQPWRDAGRDAPRALRARDHTRRACRDVGRRVERRVPGLATADRADRQGSGERLAGSAPRGRLPAPRADADRRAGQPRRPRRARRTAASPGRRASAARTARGRRCPSAHRDIRPAQRPGGPAVGGSGGGRCAGRRSDSRRAAAGAVG
jgi:DNA-binding NarL/FixJ family response regulator